MQSYGSQRINDNLIYAKCESVAHIPDVSSTFESFNDLRICFEGRTKDLSSCFLEYQAQFATFESFTARRAIQPSSCRQTVSGINKLYFGYELIALGFTVATMSID